MMSSSEEERNRYEMKKKTYRWWSQRTPAVFPVFPLAPHTHEPAGSSPGGQTLSPTWPPGCSGFHIPADKTNVFPQRHSGIIHIITRDMTACY